MIFKNKEGIPATGAWGIRAPGQTLLWGLIVTSQVRATFNTPSDYTMQCDATVTPWLRKIPAAGWEGQGGYDIIESC